MFQSILKSAAICLLIIQALTVLQKSRSLSLAGMAILRCQPLMIDSSEGMLNNEFDLITWTTPVTGSFNVRGPLT